MRGEFRQRATDGTKLLLACVLVGSALVAIARGVPGWSNYWGGFVYAPVALAVGVLFLLAIRKRRDPAYRRRENRRPKRNR